jgi:hypothetical protein
MPRQSLGGIVEFTTHGCPEATLVLCVVDLGLSLGVEWFRGGFHDVHFSHLDSILDKARLDLDILGLFGYSIIKHQYNAPGAGPLIRNWRPLLVITQTSQLLHPAIELQTGTGSEARATSIVGRYF